MISISHNKTNSHCVLYLLLEKYYSKGWLRNIEQLVVRQMDISIVLVGLPAVCASFCQQTAVDEQQIFQDFIDWDTSDGFQPLFSFHHQYAPQADCLIIKAEVFVPETLLSGFAKILASNRHIGTISPLTDQGQLFSLFHEDQSKIPLSQVNQVLQRISNNTPIELPFFYPNIVYWRSSAVQAAVQLGAIQTAVTQIALSTGYAGYLHVIAPVIFIKDETQLSMEAIREIDQHPLSVSILMQHPLAGLKQQVKAFYQSYESLQVVQNAGPVQLHIMHSWGGGIHRWVCDFIDADELGKNYVLKSIGDWGAFGKVLALYNHPDDDKPIKQWQFYYPIHGTAITHLQYNKIFKELVDDYGIEIILISSLIGHALDVLDTGLQTALILHDYYPFCPAIYIYYDGICTTCDNKKLSQCSAHNPLNFLFKGVPAEQWMGVRKRYVELVVAKKLELIVPSESVSRHYQLLLPELSNMHFTCIPHGLPEQVANVQQVEPQRNKRLKILLLGKLDNHKGLELFCHIADAIAEFADLILLGCGSEGAQFENIQGLTVEQNYQPHELNSKLCNYAPDIGLLLSIWPETFSYTLSELMAHAIPTVVTAHGALQERVIHGSNGFVVKAEPQCIISQLQQLSNNPTRLDQVRINLQHQEIRTTKMMVADYQNLLQQPANSSAKNFRPVQPLLDAFLSQSLEVNEGGFIEVMQKLQYQLLAMINKLPGINKFTRYFFKFCIKVWIFFPVRFASWYIKKLSG